MLEGQGVCQWGVAGRESATETVIWVLRDDTRAASDRLAFTGIKGNLAVPPLGHHSPRPLLTTSAIHHVPYLAPALGKSIHDPHGLLRLPRLHTMHRPIYANFLDPRTHLALWRQVPTRTHLAPHQRRLEPRNPALHTRHGIGSRSKRGS